MILSSWALDNRRLNLNIDGPNDFDFSIFSESNEWMLVNSSAWKKVERCGCNHTGLLQFNQLTYSMMIRRRVGFYVYALIIPSVLLSLLMPLTFWIPPSGDGRIMFGICLLVFFCPSIHPFFLVVAGSKSRRPMSGQWASRDCRVSKFHEDGYVDRPRLPTRVSPGRLPAPFSERKIEFSLSNGVF